MYRYWKNFGVVKRCMNCNKKLPQEFSLINVDHLLEKSRYKDVEEDDNYFFLVCGDCHNKRNNGYPGKKHKKAIKDAEKRYRIRENKRKE